MNEVQLLHELTPVAAQLTARHYETCKPWYPHEFVPWSLGRDFVEGEQWDAREVPLPDSVRSALFVNLLTEDNLPYYFRAIDRMFGREGAWREWSHRWTAEEARHSIALRDFMTVTRAIDPRALEDGRMSQMSGGQVPDPDSAVDGFVYVALQELATRIAHRNTGKALQQHLGGHPVGEAGYEVISRVAADENFHFLFYRDLTSAALEIAPSLVLPAIERQVREFEMPGTGIPGFKKHAEAIARDGLYNLQQHHDQILQPVVVRWWKIESLSGLTSEAEQARDAVLDRITRIGVAARRLADRALEAAERARTAIAGPTAAPAV
ncbi:MAG: acyl-ACP desaturase [Actinobacteria bacterium]|nr:acyl-ACP desaturase [Actinomycetota bacterium]